MNGNHFIWSSSFRIAARLTSIASIGFLAAFVFGGEEELGGMRANEMVGFAFFPVGIICGMVLGWWRTRGEAW